MRQQFLKLLVLTFISLAITNCQKEELEIIDNPHQTEFIVKEYSFQTANEKPKFKESFSKVTKGITRSANQNSNERSTSEFSIDSTSIK